MSQGARWPLEAGEGTELDSPLEPPEGRQLPDLCPPKMKKIHLCCFKFVVICCSNKRRLGQQLENLRLLHKNEKPKVSSWAPYSI